MKNALNEKANKYAIEYWKQNTKVIAADSHVLNAIKYVLKREATVASYYRGEDMIGDDGYGTSEHYIKEMEQALEKISKIVNEFIKNG